MARKDPSLWSESYHKRMDRAKAKAQREGRVFNQQAARGHKAREHVIRKARELERERDEGLLTTQQKAAIRRWADQQAKRIADMDADELAEQVRGWATLNGYGAFQAMAAKQRGMHRQYLSELKRKSYGSRGMQFLEAMAEGDDVPDVRWFYYH